MERQSQLTPIVDSGVRLSRLGVSGTIELPVGRNSTVSPSATRCAMASIIATGAPYATAGSLSVAVSVTGIDPAEMWQLMCFMWRVDPGPDGQEQARRLTAIVIDGCDRTSQRVRQRTWSVRRG